VLSKPVVGDAAEQRLKTEVMQMPARDRRRLKEVQDVSATLEIKYLDRGGDGWEEEAHADREIHYTGRHHRPSESLRRCLNPRVPLFQTNQTPRLRPRQRRRSQQDK